MRQAPKVVRQRVSSVSEVESPRAWRSWVSDMAGILSPQVEAEIDALASRIRQQTGAEIVVVTVPGIQGAQEERQLVKRFATRLFNYWGIGDRDKNNGVLLLVSVSDRRVEVEIGSGLNKVFNRDDWLQDMIHSRITPSLRLQRYDDGLLQGVQACCDQLRASDAEVSSPQRWRQGAGLLWTTTAVTAIGSLWLALKRPHPPRCACGAAMARLRKAKDEELVEGQQMERALGAVQHVLCTCRRPGCRKKWAQGGRSFKGPQRIGGAVSRRMTLSPEEVQGLVKSRDGLAMLSEVQALCRFEVCRVCGFRTCLRRTTELVPATNLTGWRREQVECCNCGAEWSDETILPARSFNLSTSDYNWSSGGTSSSGGGFGGGSSSGGGSGGSF